MQDEKIYYFSKDGDWGDAQDIMFVSLYETDRDIYLLENASDDERATLAGQLSSYDGLPAFTHIILPHWDLPKFRVAMEKAVQLAELRYSCDDEVLLSLKSLSRIITEAGTR